MHILRPSVLSIWQYPGSVELLNAPETNASVPSRPRLSLDSISHTYGDGGSVSPNFVADGAPLMNQKLLESETRPTVSYQNLTGHHAQFQFSSNSDFLEIVLNHTDLFNSN